MQREELNRHNSAYEADELPVLYSAIYYLSLHAVTVVLITLLVHYTVYTEHLGRVCLRQWL